TCKQYDCRVFAATQDMAYEESPAIKERIKTWRFKYSTNKSVEAQQAVNVAIKFLADNATRFPKGVVPRTLPQRAVMAIRIHTEFIGYKNEMDKEIGLLIDKITLKLSG
ncbi:MAG: hypothetical protein OEW08_04500, partial [Gammaproteobacteria bacterium]|nr:hypothetical protein [Gammaproteobacteria bacterium]